MKIPLGFKILGSFALIVVLALGAAVGTGGRVTRSRYDEFAHRQDSARAESLSLILGAWTAEAAVSGMLPPLPSSVSLFYLPVQERSALFPLPGVLNGHRVEKDMLREHEERNRIVITDLSGKVLLDTSGNSDSRLEPGDSEPAVIRDGDSDVGYLYVGRTIPGFRRSSDVPFLRTARLTTWIITGVIFVFAMLLGLILTLHITGPVKILNTAVQKVEAGNLETRVPDSRRDELGALSRSFNAMAEFLDSADKQRRRFIADSAHELRTPVSLIRTRIEMMEEGIYPMNRENLQALSTESGRLIYLLDELRTLADIESPEPVISKEILNLPDLLQEAVTAADPVFLRKEVDVEIRTGSPYPVNADRGKLLQVLINLLSNALRYADYRILIRIGKQAESSGWTELIVEDDGPGIPAQERGKIFQRFYRVDTSRNRSSGGSGLGLAICREIVKAHGGRIAAGASRELGGAEIRMVLPGSAAPDRPPERFRG